MKVLVGEDGFKVESSSQKGVFYKVKPEKPECSCPAFRFRYLRQAVVCKHVQAVQEYLHQRKGKVYEKILGFVKEIGEVDAVLLLEKFGEEDVNELLRRGELLERKGKIVLLE